jgi:trigger factor
MEATIEALEGNKVKVSVSVGADEFEKDIDDAFRKIAREVRIPGFRPGKAPRRVLEARIGSDYARAQALNDAVPRYYADAVKAHDVDVIAAPEVEITEGEEAGPVAFEAVVEVRPVVQVPGYGGLRVTIASPEPSDEDVDAQIERLRNQFAELEDVERPAAEGDYVTIDIYGSQDGEALEGLTAEDYLYELGSGGILPEIDEQLTDAGAGDELEFEAAHPNDEAAVLDFRVVVKAVKERVLPDVDDEWANEASEFETLDELRADLAERLRSVKRAQAQMQLREKTGEALAALVEEEVPEALVSSELQNRLQDLAMRLQAQGIGLEQWIAASGRQPDEFVAELREKATEAVRVDLALRAVADAESIECDDDDLTEEFESVAARLELEPEQVRAQFERADQVSAVRSDVRKRKAFDWLLERVEIVDEDGHPVDRASLEFDTDDAEEADEAAPDEAESSTEAGAETGDDE